MFRFNAHRWSEPWGKFVFLRTFLNISSAYVWTFRVHMNIYLRKVASEGINHHVEHCIFVPASRVLFSSRCPTFRVSLLSSVLWLLSAQNLPVLLAQSASSADIETLVVWSICDCVWSKPYQPQNTAQCETQCVEPLAPGIVHLPHWPTLTARFPAAPLPQGREAFWQKWGWCQTHGFFRQNWTPSCLVGLSAPRAPTSGPEILRRHAAAEACPTLLWHVASQKPRKCLQSHLAGAAACTTSWTAPKTLLGPCDGLPSSTTSSSLSLHSIDCLYCGCTVWDLPPSIQWPAECWVHLQLACKASNYFAGQVACGAHVSGPPSPIPWSPLDQIQCPLHIVLARPELLPKPSLARQQVCPSNDRVLFSPHIESHPPWSHLLQSLLPFCPHQGANTVGDPVHLKLHSCHDCDTAGLEKELPGSCQKQVQASLAALGKKSTVPLLPLLLPLLVSSQRIHFADQVYPFPSVWTGVQSHFGHVLVGAHDQSDHFHLPQD